MPQYYSKRQLTTNVGGKGEASYPHRVDFSFILGRREAPYGRAKLTFSDGREFNLVAERYLNGEGDALEWLRESVARALGCKVQEVNFRTTNFTKSSIPEDI